MVHYNSNLSHYVTEFFLDQFCKQANINNITIENIGNLLYPRVDLLEARTHIVIKINN